MNTPMQRSFAAKRNKMTFVVIRRHVMTGSLLLHPTSVDACDGNSSTLTLMDVVDPCDVEEALAHRKTSAFYDISSSTTSPRKVSEFPTDDVEVRMVPRESHTVDPTIPRDVKESSIDPHVSDILSSFNDPFSLVQKRYQQFGSADAYVRMVMERPMVVRGTNRPVFEGDAAKIERVARSASLVVEGMSQETALKRHSYASTASSGTMGSGDGDTREPRLHQSQPDPTVPGVIQRVSFAQLDQLNDSRRFAGRQPSLVNLLPVQPESEVIEKRSAPPYPDDRVGQKLIVNVTRLDLEPSFEPVFGSIAIYDAKARRKVTENFYFDVNSDSLRSMLRIPEESLPYGRCNQGAFSINCSLNDLFMVVKIDKVLHACDIADASEPYSTSKDEKTREKLGAAAAEYCSRLGSYRMPLGFMVVDLYKVISGSGTLDKAEVMTASTFTTGSAVTVSGDAPLATAETESIMSADRVSISSTSTFRRVGSGTSAATVLNRVRTPLQKRRFLGGVSFTCGDDGNSISATSDSVGAKQTDVSLTNLQTLTLSLNSFFKQEQERLSDDELFKLLADARKSGGKMSRLKTFPVNMSLQLSGGTGEELMMRLNTDMLRVAPFTGGPDTVLTKDVQEFAVKGQYAVNTSYRNLLYVYPKSVNLSNRQGTARNISISVELMDGKERAQRVVFPTGAGTQLTDHVNTNVVYHCKTPQMSDEVKMRIPPELDDGYHLLFTFFHISCKATAKDEEFEYPIGYSWLPLYRDGRLVSGDFSLPICLERPPPSYGYLSPEGALPNIKWLDGHRSLFNVSLNAISTVHTQDEHLERFFMAVCSLSSTDRRRPPVNEQALITAVQGILKSRPEPMVAFLYNVLDKLLSLISHPPYSDLVSSACFETMGQLVKICTMLLDSCLDSHGRSALLISYIHYFKIAMKESKSKSQLCRDSSIDKNKPGSPESQKLFNIIEDMERSSIGKLQMEALPVFPNKAVHEEVAELWVRSGGQAREMGFLNSWFFLELMMKSMAEYLAMTGRLYLVRRSRFGERYIRSLDSLSAAIAAEVVSRLSKDGRQATSIASSWAFFLRDVFSLMDRSYIMGLIRDFNQAVSVKIACCSEPMSTTLMLLKLDFLRIVCSHEHFVILNLPFGHSALSSSGSSSSLGFAPAPPSQLQPPSPGGSSLSSRSTATSDSWGSLGAGELNSEFRRNHFLVGLAIADLAAVLETSSNSMLQAKAIGVIRNLLATHEADSRLSDSSVKSRVAALYLPLVTVILDVYSQIHDPFAKNGTGDRNRFSSDDPLYSTPGVNPKVAMAIAGMGEDISPPRTPTDGKPAPIKKSKLTLELSRQLLACFCWVLKHIDSSGLRHWVRDLTPVRLSQLLEVLQLCVACFEYKPHSQYESVGSIPGETEESVESRKEGVKWRRGAPVLKPDSRRTTQILYEDESLLDAALCTEVTLCALDMVETVVRVISMPGSDHLLFALPVILRELMYMLACNQSVQTLDCVFASQRALIVKYPELVFEQETEQCGELCLQLLRHCSSRLPSIRSQAAASLYLLMRESFENGGSLARVKMQITMSLSTLVSNGTRKGMWLNEDCLRRCLKTVLIYAETDANTDHNIRANASFSEQVKDLVFNLHMILSDTVKMKEYANDFEMTLDLMYRIAKGYQNNPDLRLTWLLNMASLHSERGLNCEAAQCMLHAAALAAEYIAMTTTESYMPRGAVDFQPISENVLEESAVSDDVVSPEVDGICESRHFTAAGLVHLVEKSAVYLEKALMYELLPDLFKVIEPVVREWRDFRRLSSIHARLSEALARIEPTVPIIEDTADAWSSPLRSSDKRCFGSYFRVGFYGPRFGDLDGEEFVYKEAPFTKLSEISHRLESFYTDRFGKGVVEVIKDSNNVIRSSHDSSKAYLQVTYVEPFFDKWERRRRPTHFERSHTINRFIYATPFTRDGRAHGELKDQYKRRTILTIQHSFPYVKTRIRIVEREQKILQPIQVAIEDVEKKTRELSAAISQSPPDAKMLQMVLQGCIGTTVNQGPVQVANVFLTDVSLDDQGKPIDTLQNKLRLSFRDFSKRCADALTLNKQLIQPDQFAYQTELQRNYAEFTRKMAPIMGCNKREPQSCVRTAAEHAITLSSELGPATVV